MSTTNSPLLSNTDTVPGAKPYNTPAPDEANIALPEGAGPASTDLSDPTPPGLPAGYNPNTGLVNPLKAMPTTSQQPSDKAVVQLSDGTKVIGPRTSLPGLLKDDSGAKEIPLEHGMAAVRLSSGHLVVGPLANVANLRKDDPRARIELSGSATERMEPSSLPAVTRMTTGQLPKVGAVVGGLATSPGVVTTPLGVGTGAGAGKAAELAINRAIFGDEEPSPISPEGLKQVGVTGLEYGAFEGVMSKLLGLGQSKGNILDEGESAIAKMKHVFGTPEEPVYSVPTDKPVSPHVDVDTPFDDARIRKSVGKDLSPEARQTLRDHAGDTIEAGSSAENHLTKSVAPINDTITTNGLKLNQIVDDAPPMQNSYSENAGLKGDIEKLKEELPASVQDQYSKDIDKEVARYEQAIDSHNAKEVLAAKRELDQRIKSFTAPEEPIDSPASAADAARVTLRRGFNRLLSTEIPATKPLNEILSKNLEIRSVLDKKLGDIARDPVAADSQYRSELAKGKTIVQNKAADAAAQARHEDNKARVAKNWSRLKIGAVTVPSISGTIYGIKKLIEAL